MRALLVARKNLIELLREPQLTLLTLLVPLGFLLITYAGYNTPLLITYPLYLIDKDPQSTALIDALESRQYADGRPVFELKPSTDRGAVEAGLRGHKAVASVEINPAEEAEHLPQITILADAVYQPFMRASLLLDNTLFNYANQTTGHTPVVRVEEEPLFTTGPQTEFDLYAPGMTIFALLLIIPQTAMLVGREIRWNTLRRLRLTRLDAAELLGGISLAQMVVAVIQVVLLFAVALALGYNNQGELWLAVLIGLVVSFSCVGQGLLVACFIENDSQAINVGSTVAMFEVFLSGAFYQLPAPTMFTLFNHQISAFDIFPATHGFMALQQVLTYGVSLSDVGFRLGATLLLSVIYFAIGIIVFQRAKMQSNL
jgi:ABC-2 type transport system permease protein